MSENTFVLQSERLDFRLFEADDFTWLEKLDTDPEVRAYFPTGILTADQVREKITKHQESYREKGYSDFALVQKLNNIPIGRAGFSQMDDGEIEVGYVLLKEHWHYGYASEALAALLTWAREHISVKRIIAFTPTPHKASIHIMEKCGMQHFKTANRYGVRCEFYEYLL